MELTEKSQGDYSDELHAWIDTISFSKPKRNLTRDFSDAVLMAEILKVYYPRYVDLHNYIPANSVRLKRDNWNTLNRRVLSKIDMKLNKETIDQLANAQRGVIEKVLMDLRAKLSKAEQCLSQGVCDMNTNTESDVLDTNEQKIIEDIDRDNPVMEESNEEEVNEEIISSTNTSVVNWTNSIVLAIKWIFSWIFIWNYFSMIFDKSTGKIVADSYSKKTDWKNLDANKSVPFPVHMQLKKDLHEKIDMISTLSQKVAHLENAIKLSERQSPKETIETVQSTIERGQCSKEENSISCSPSKVLSQPPNEQNVKSNEISDN